MSASRRLRAKMFAVFAMISALSAMFRQSSASGDGDGENDRQECFHSTKVFVADRSRALIRLVVAIAGRTADSGSTNAISNAIGDAKFFSCSHDAVIRVYDAAGSVIETHEHTGDFKEP